MSDWTFIDKFGKDIAKSTRVTTRSFWLAAMTGCASSASLEGLKESFDEVDMKGSSEKAKKWFEDHPEEVTKLLLCLAAPSIAETITPTLLGIVGFGDLGPILGGPAAGIQAVIEPIAAGSPFASLQSAAMGGYGLNVVEMIVTSGVIMGTCPAIASNFLEAMKE